MLVETRRLNKREINVVTSLDIAETFEKRHDNVLKDIRELNCSNEFRLLNFEESTYVNSQNKKQPMYYITRDGFTLLVMGYTGEKAMKFKEAYIRQFNAMEATLQGKLIEREKGIVVRQAFTKALKESGENDRMHGNAYSNYTDHIVYKQVFGMRACELREKYGIGKKDDLRDCFTQEELRQVQNAEMLVSSLMEYGWGFNEIKEFVLTKANKMIED